MDPRRSIDVRRKKTLILVGDTFYDVDEDSIVQGEDDDHVKVDLGLRNSEEPEEKLITVPKNNVIHTGSGRLESTNETDDIRVMVKKLYLLLEDNKKLAENFGADKEALVTKVFGFLRGMEENAPALCETKGAKQRRIIENQAVCHALFHAISEPKNENVTNLTSAAPNFIKRNSWAKGLLIAIVGILTFLGGAAATPFTGLVGAGVAGGGGLITALGIWKACQGSSGKSLQGAQNIITQHIKLNS